MVGIAYQIIINHQFIPITQFPEPKVKGSLVNVRLASILNGHDMCNKLQIPGQAKQSCQQKATAQRTLKNITNRKMLACVQITVFNDWFSALIQDKLGVFPAVVTYHFSALPPDRLPKLLQKLAIWLAEYLGMGRKENISEYGIFASYLLDILLANKLVDYYVFEIANWIFSYVVTLILCILSCWSFYISTN